MNKIYTLTKVLLKNSRGEKSKKKIMAYLLYET